ncbi:MAG: GNAT family N-acetyltransferase [Chloroflexota bacterium]|jgi:L-amino acid N-acyltransferase YncA
MTGSVIETYRNLITLDDGVRLLIRPLTADDREALVLLYANAQPSDLRPLRHDVTNAELVNRWVDELDYSHVLPLLALLKDRIVGNATLHHRSPPYQHIGEVRIYLAQDFRRRGLGSKMLAALIDFARKEGLYWLQAEVFASQPRVIRAFEKLGFEQRCVLEDYFMLPDRQTEDVAVLMMKLLERIGEF